MQFRFLSFPTNQSSRAKPEICPRVIFETKQGEKHEIKKSPQGLIKKTQKVGLRKEICHVFDDLKRISEKATKSPAAERATPAQRSGRYQLFTVNM